VAPDRPSSKSAIAEVAAATAAIDDSDA
jgi:hypothetical protein